MYIIATVLLVMGAAAGGTYGVMNHLTPMETILFVCGGGFVGSVAGGLVFTVLYFTAPDEPSPTVPFQEPAIPLPAPEITHSRELSTETAILPMETEKQKIKRLKKEIRTLKKNRRKNTGL